MRGAVAECGTYTYTSASAETRWNIYIHCEEESLQRSRKMRRPFGIFIVSIEVGLEGFLGERFDEIVFLFCGSLVYLNVYDVEVFYYECLLRVIIVVRRNPT